jgi:hypothetical protein
MIEINVSSDIDRAVAEVGDFFRSQVPYAVSRAMNSTMFDVRKQIVEVTYPKAFTVRNPTLPKILWRITKKAVKRDLVAILEQVDLGGKPRDWTEVQVTGGTKKLAKNIAIPTQPGKERTATGRIAKSMKPLALKKTFVVSKNGKKFIFQRKRKGAELMYVVVPSAEIKSTFPFYDDAFQVINERFVPNFAREFNLAVANSRLKSE